MKKNFIYSASFHILVIVLVSLGFGSSKSGKTFINEITVSISSQGFSSGNISKNSPPEEEQKEVVKEPEPKIKESLPKENHEKKEPDSKDFPKKKVIKTPQKKPIEPKPIEPEKEVKTVEEIKPKEAPSSSSAKSEGEIEELNSHLSAREALNLKSQLKNCYRCEYKLVFFTGPRKTH